jgi:hypothetical protein
MHTYCICCSYTCIWYPLHNQCITYPLHIRCIHVRVHTQCIWDSPPWCSGSQTSQKRQGEPVCTGTAYVLHTSCIVGAYDCIVGAYTGTAVLHKCGIRDAYTLHTCCMFGAHSKRSMRAYAGGMHAKCRRMQAYASLFHRQHPPNFPPLALAPLRLRLVVRLRLPELVEVVPDEVK